MKKITLMLAAAIVLLPATAFAEDTTVSAKLSTLGFGIDVAFPVTAAVDARIGFNTFSYNINQNSNGTNFTGKLNLGSLAALADWHPMDGSFRVSGGLMYNNNKFNMNAVPAGGTITLGNTAYAGVSANSTVDFSKVVPYLGIGWGSAAKDQGFSFSSDIGIMFQGTPRANITTTGAAVAAADIAKANADMNAALKNFRFYPVLSVGLGYTF
ncbi:MAG: hypothetical protein PHI11_04080 [Gallionella sp.]|nr:hypothetical protein [Gallionella sp.]